MKVVWVLSLVLLVFGQSPLDKTGFKVTIENLSGGSSVPTGLSPAVWSVHSGVTPLFNIGQPATAALQKLAEDGYPVDLFTQVNGTTIPAGVKSAGIAYSDPASKSGAAPGQLIEFGIYAAKGDKLSFVSMFGETNDRFFGTSQDGVSLFNPDTGVAFSGWVDLVLYDAGTEVNERPGFGVNQPARQPRTNVGQNENGVVLPSTSNNDTFTYPETKTVIRVYITAAVTYRIKVDNLSNGSITSSPLSGIIWAVHDYPNPFFVAGQNASAGLELLAEDGSPAKLLAELENTKGIIFKGVTRSIPAGSFIEIFVTVPVGSYFSFASMLVVTNDRFYAPFPRGLYFFDENGPKTGDITSGFELWDAGTEVNQKPGAGTNQPLNTAPGINIGTPENSVVKHALGNKDGYTYPETIFKATAAPLTGRGFTAKSLEQKLSVSFVFSNMFRV